jgi:hypothetical protein
MADLKQENLLLHRIKLLALISVFLLPFIAGWLAFYVFEYRPGSKNYGDLIQPARPLTFPVLKTHNGEALNASFWNKWTFVLLDKKGCGQQCRDNLYYLRQLRIALGRDSDRVQNLYISDHPLSGDFVNFLQEYPDLKVVENARPEIFSLFVLPEKEPGQEPRLYLVDPNGNFMMTYPAMNNPSSILSDMRRLLKISQIG